MSQHKAVDYRSKRKLLLRSTKLTKLIFPNDVFYHQNSIEKKGYFFCINSNSVSEYIQIYIYENNLPLLPWPSPPWDLSPGLSHSFHPHFRLASAHPAEKVCFILLLYQLLHRQHHVNVRTKRCKIFKLSVSQITGLGKYFVKNSLASF